MNTLKNLAVVTGCVLAGYLLSLAGKGKPSEPVEATPVSAEAPAAEVPAVPVPSDPPKVEPPAPAAQPEQTCTICNGAGATRVNGAWVKCGVCGGDGTIDDDPRDPEAQPGFKPTALYTQPQEPPKAVPTEYVTVQQSYRYGMFGRRVGFRNVTMTRAAYEAQRGQAYYGGGCASGRCGR